MPGSWQPTGITPPHIWTNPIRVESWAHERPHAPGRRIIIIKSLKGNIMDNRPSKRFNISKGGLFHTLPVEILSIIDDWVKIFEYNDKQISVINQIKIPKNSVLCKLTYTNLKPYHNFGPLSLYGTTRYEWAHRYYNNN